MDPDDPSHLGAPGGCPRCGAQVEPGSASCAACAAPLLAATELAPGTRLHDGRYRVLDVIGRGGFGITYEGGDERLRRRVAIKELFPEAAVRHEQEVLVPARAAPAFQAAKERFLREARVLARFTHPGVVQVYEVFEEHGTAYLVMERLHARTLLDVMRTRGEPLDEDEVRDVAGRVASALRPVHAAGVLHRDLNPTNVMLTEHGRIVLIDFGLARDFVPDQTVGMTRVVTPGYAPIEQYRGEARFGPATDVYGLAATCYRLLTGKVPVPALERDAGAHLVAPHRLRPEVSKELSDGLLDGLEVEPSHRPQDLDAFLARIGVRRLPDEPRSLLLGRPGAEFEPPGPDREATLLAPAAPQPPPEIAAAIPLADPGPAVAVRPTAVPPPPPSPPAPPPDADATEVARAPVAPGPLASLDPDRTAGPAGWADATTPRPPGDLGAAPPWPAPDPPAPGGRSGEGTSLPLDPPGRAKLVWPAVAVTVALAGAVPVLVTVLLVVVVLPALATVGDTVVRQRHDLGFVLVRTARNALAGVLRCSPVVGVSALMLGLWYLAEGATVPQWLLDAMLRFLGSGTALALWLTNRDGSDRFRTGVGMRALVVRAVPDGRTTERLVVAWVVAAALVAGALWLAPDPFPLP